MTTCRGTAVAWSICGFDGADREHVARGHWSRLVPHGDLLPSRRGYPRARFPTPMLGPISGAELDSSREHGSIGPCRLEGRQHLLAFEVGPIELDTKARLLGQRNPAVARQRGVFHEV